MNITLEPIGTIQTPYKDRYSAPRQPGADDRNAEGTIILEPGRNFGQALDDLAGFEKIWVIYVFHRNPNWNPKVQTPRGKGKRGVFATRSPHRPNPIGLSLVDLIEIKGLRIKVGNIDILDGTPILDIKPYLPYAESFPNAKAVWLDEIPKTDYKVSWAMEEKKKVKHIEEKECVNIIDHTNRVLTLDPEPHAYRRIKRGKDGELIFAYKYWRLHFTLKGNKVHIHSVTDAREE
jgi:tRNA (adenine37-N6)-methyltransferase